MSARLDSDDDRHVANASFATATALSTSATLASATSPCCWPVAGLKTGPVLPEAPATRCPLIQWSIVYTCCSARFVVGVQVQMRYWERPRLR